MARGSDSERVAAVEDALRALAVAAGAVRLYPPSSPIREEAIERATGAIAACVADGPVQLKIDRERFLLDNVPVGAGRSSTAALAEALHALQVGQVVFGKGIAPGEVAAFLEILAREAREVRVSGGARAALVAAGASNLAVVEVSLRASEERGLASVDLVSAPLDEIAPHVVSACEQWAAGAVSGGELADDIERAVSGVEPAARELALTRIAQSLLRLDEQTRVGLVEKALARSPAGRPMEGMLQAIAKLPPAALARLLRLLSEKRNADAETVLQEVALPLDVLKEVRPLIRHAPVADAMRGIPETVDASSLASDAEVDDVDQMSIEALARAATAASAAERALAACVEVFEQKRDAGSLKAVGDAIVAALRAGSFASLRPPLGLVTQATRAPETAGEAAAIARTIALEALEAFQRADAAQRPAIAHASGQLAEQIATVASPEIRNGSADRALAAVQLLLALGDKRLTSVAVRGLEHPDLAVRSGTLRALADAGSPEATAALAEAVHRGDPKTRIAAVREIGRVGASEALPALLRALAEEAPLRRNYELKLEILATIEQMRAAQAREMVARLARRRAFGKKARHVARRAHEVLTALGDEGRDEGERSP